MKQRAIDNIGMADDPTHIGSGPVHVARCNIVNAGHAPLERNDVTARIPNNPFRFSGRTRRVKNVQGMVGSDRHTVDCFSVFDRLPPIQVAVGAQLGELLRTLQNDATFGFVLCDFDCAIQQWFVRNNSRWLDATGSRQHNFWRGVINSHCQFIARKSPENDRVDRAKAGACQHGNNRLGNHWHIDEYPIAGRNALGSEHPGE